MATKTSEIYQIKVTLRGTKPPIWRRLLVPADMTLEQLHRVLQSAREGEDCHLHEFEIDEERYGPPDPDGWDVGPETLSERKARLSDVLGDIGAKAIYTYDFGDSWEHRITVEKILPPEAGRKYPVCVAGKMQGPPEDCGGVFGYYELLAVVNDPAHTEHKHLREWLGKDFDPEAFSMDEVNRRLNGRARTAS